MTLPSTLKKHSEWTFVGPMGPELPLKLQEYPTIAIDGGANFVTTPILWVGDSDSRNSEVDCLHKFEHPSKKSQSDLALGLNFFSDELHYKFHFWGFLGGRSDHELFNMGEVNYFLRNHPECQIIFYDQSGKEKFHFLGAGDWKFTHRGTFSVGSFQQITLRLYGSCEFPIHEDQILTPLSSLGLSNHGSGKIFVETSGPLFIYYPEGL